MAINHLKFTQPVLFILMALYELGFGLCLTPNQRLMLAMIQQRGGAAGAMLNVSQTMEQAIGAAIVGITITGVEDHARRVLVIAAVFAFMGTGLSWGRKEKKKIRIKQ